MHIKRLEADAATMFRVIKKVARTNSSQVKVLEQRLLALERTGLRVETQPRDFLGDDAAAMLHDIYSDQASQPHFQQRASSFAQARAASSERLMAIPLLGKLRLAELMLSSP